MIITIVVLHSCSGQEKNNLLTEENELEDGKNKEIEVKGEPKEEIFEIEEYLITPKSIGFAFLGQSLADFTKKFESYKLESIPVWSYCVDGGGDGILVSKDKEPFLFVWTMEGNDLIHSVVGLSERLKTKEGVGPKSSIRQLIKVYPDIMIRQDGLCEEIEYFYESKSKIKYEFISRDSVKIGRYVDEDDASIPFDTVRLVDHVVIRN